MNATVLPVTCNLSPAILSDLIRFSANINPASMGAPMPSSSGAKLLVGCSCKEPEILVAPQCGAIFRFC